MRKVNGFPLWIGTARDARDIKGVLDAGIEAIVDLAMLCEPVVPTREMVYLRLPLVDSEGNPPWLILEAVHAVEGLVRLGVPSLVACDGGMSRSPVIVAAALRFQMQDVALEEMLQKVTQNGPADVNPALWAEVKRIVESANEPQYRPRE